MNGAVRSNFDPDNLWHNIVVTYNGNGSDGMFLFLDGTSLIPIILNPITSLNTANSFIHNIGNMNNSNNFKGRYDDIGIWNRALTNEEVQALYNGCNILPTTIAGNLSPFTLASADYSCNNNSGSTYEWVVTNGVITAGQGTSNVSVLWGAEGAGTLTVVETNAEGCSGAPAAINVEVVCATTASSIDGPLGPNVLTATTYTCNGASGSSYLWTISNGVITSGQGTNAVSVLWAGTGLGSISVQETTNANCTGDVISIDVVVIPTNIEEEENTLILFYPNPTSNSLTVDFGMSALSNGSTIRVMNSLGQTMYKNKVITNREIIDVTTWSTGTYLVSLLNDKGTEVQTKTLIIQ
jgi:hypothetical protein